MTDRPRQHDIRDLWQDQGREAIRMSLDEIQRKAGTFHKKVNRRNLREYIAAVLAVAIYVIYICVFPNLVMRIGSGMVIAGVLYVVYQLHRRGSARPLPEDCSFECCLDFHRRELERQRDALRAIWSWYLGPLLPGLVLFLVGTELARKQHGHGHHWIGLAVTFAFCALVFIGIAELNQWAARWLQKQIDELNAAAK